MLFNTKKWSLAGLLILSSSITYADTITASFGGVTDTGSSFNQFQVVTNNVTVTVSGWSDTADHRKGKHQDKNIRRAKDLDRNSSYGGSWSIQNQDEGSTCHRNEHSADNFNCHGAAEQDYDFFMLAFSEAVSLTQATYGWVNGNAINNQVSVVALKTTKLKNTLNGRSWGGVKKNHTLSSDYAQMEGSGGYYTNFAGTNVDNEFSTHWLIGALNSVFGGSKAMEGNDGMKLAGVSFNKQEPVGPASIPEPSSILLFCLAIMGLTASNRRKLK